MNPLTDGTPLRHLYLYACTADGTGFPVQERGSSKDGFAAYLVDDVWFKAFRNPDATDDKHVLLLEDLDRK